MTKKTKTKYPVIADSKVFYKGVDGKTRSGYARLMMSFPQVAFLVTRTLDDDQSKGVWVHETKLR